MGKLLRNLHSFAKSMDKRTRVLKALVFALTVVFLLQFYFVRELLTAEFVLALGFAVVMLLGGPAYAIGSAGVTLLRQCRTNRVKTTPRSEEIRRLDYGVDLVVPSGGASTKK